jgi:serine/threonine-protein kinase
LNKLQTYYAWQEREAGKPMKSVIRCDSCGNLMPMDGSREPVRFIDEDENDEFCHLKMICIAESGNACEHGKAIRTASVLNQLKHPNILRYDRYDYSEEPKYLLREDCHGGSVDTLMGRVGGKLPVGTATDITLQVLDALGYAHRQRIAYPEEGETAREHDGVIQGVIHREIKPANFFIKYDSGPPTIKLDYFEALDSIGRIVDIDRMPDGTPLFMPRQGIIKYSCEEPAIDVWAAAAAYYFMLTGCYTKDYDFKKDLWMQALKNPNVPIRERDSGIDARLAAVIDQALTEKPVLGFKTARELKTAIEEAV